MLETYPSYVGKLESFIQKIDQKRYPDLDLELYATRLCEKLHLVFKRAKNRIASLVNSNIEIVTNPTLSLENYNNVRTYLKNPILFIPKPMLPIQCILFTWKGCGWPEIRFNESSFLN